MFYGHTSLDKCVYLMVYVDDIIIIENDHYNCSIKNHLLATFRPKYGSSKIFLWY